MKRKSKEDSNWERHNKWQNVHLNNSYILHLEFRMMSNWLLTRVSQGKFHQEFREVKSQLEELMFFGAWQVLLCFTNNCLHIHRLWNVIYVTTFKHIVWEWGPVHFQKGPFKIKMPFVWGNCPVEGRMTFSQTVVYNSLEFFTFSHGTEC